MNTQTLENGCIVEHTLEGTAVRITVYKPDKSLSVTALVPPEYVGSDHYVTHLEEQARGLLLHGTQEQV